MSEAAAHKCHGKRRHRSERAAVSVAKSWQKRTGCEMRAYECEFCRGWHVGNVYPANSREARSLKEEKYA